jgi:hypothetical protein
MKILYLSCHSILEYDEVKLLTGLGHYVFSPGAYVEPSKPGDPTMRPGLLNIKYDQEHLDKYHPLCDEGRADGKQHLTKEFVDMFDCVIVMHIPSWISNNWDAIKHKPVIWRTIGQSIGQTEAELHPYRIQGLKIVRYSPMEENIPGYIGSDALIRFYKDENEFKDWNGGKENIITFAQSMEQRSSHCNFNTFVTVTEGMPRTLFGPGNEHHDFSPGKVPFDQLKTELRDNRVYFATGTHPASYTLNVMEAFMTGIPMVAVGRQLGNGHQFGIPFPGLYEVPNFIEHGVNGFCSDNPEVLKDCCQQLLNDHDLAKKIGTAGRETAKNLFNKPRIRDEWQTILQTI